MRFINKRCERLLKKDVSMDQTTDVQQHDVSGITLDKVFDVHFNILKLNPKLSIGHLFTASSSINILIAKHEYDADLTNKT